MVYIIRVNLLFHPRLKLTVIGLFEDLRGELVLFLAVRVSNPRQIILRFSHSSFRFPVCGRTEGNFGRVFVVRDWGLFLVTATEDRRL